MTLQEFTQKVMNEYGMKHELAEVLKYIQQQAKAIAKNGYAAVDDETVKDWIVNYQPGKAPEKPKKEPKAEAPKAKMKTSKVAQKLYDKYVKPEEKPKKEGEDYEQITLFDL